jgi:hypothetical protein
LAEEFAGCGFAHSNPARDAEELHPAPDYCGRRMAR